MLIERGTLRLYHYRPLVDEIYRVPVLLVMAATNRGYIFDLTPGQSLVEYAPGYPSKKVGGVELSPEQYDRYAAMAGERSHAGLSVLVSLPEWRAMDDEAKEDAAAGVVKRARETVRGELFGGENAPGKPASEWDAFPKDGAKAIPARRGRSPNE